ncbi:MAG: rcc01693 family protein [Pseudomonadota bacterium]
MNEGFDWEMLMRFGLGVMGLAPDQFWAMTPREFDAAVKGRLGQLGGAAPMSRAGFEALAEKYPDKEAA